MKPKILLLPVLLLTTHSSALLAESDLEGVRKAEARALAEALVESMGMAAQIPEMQQLMRDSVDESSEGFTPEEVTRLKEYMAADVEKSFLSMMADLFVQYFTLDELKAIRDEREEPSLMAKLPGWKKFCEEAGERWGREARVRAERRIGADIALEVLSAMGIDRQIPELVEGLSEKVVEIQKARDLTDEQTEQVRGIMAAEFSKSFKPAMAGWFAEYFTVPELKALRDSKETPELREKMGGLMEYTKKKAYDWGFDIGRRAVEKVLGDSDK
jgi:hypothetical protein